MPGTVITLRYASRCLRCQTALPAGSRGNWEKSTGVWCVSCPSLQGNQASAVATSTGTSPPDGWSRLVSYYISCVEAEAADERVAVSDQRKWQALPLTEERILTGRDDILRCDDIARLHDTIRADEQVVYGWPVALINERQALRVLPIATVTLEGEDVGDYTATDEPRVNPSLFEWLRRDVDVYDEIKSLVAGGLPFGDADALRGGVQQLVAHLGASVHGQIDPDNLAVPPSWSAGVHNCAVAMISSSSVATRGLVQDLQELQKAPNVLSTAAGFLVSRTVPGTSTGTRAVAAITRLNDAQEAALRSAMTEPVTVVTGPPGTGKSQFVAAVVGAAWTEGQSVLVASTNNQAVDVAVERATEHDPGVLIRTGNKQVREALPDLLESLAARDHPMESGQMVLQQLGLAIQARDRYLQGLQDRSAVEVQLPGVLDQLTRWTTYLWGPGQPGPGDPDAALVDAQQVLRARLFRRWRLRRLLRRLRIVGQVDSAQAVLEWGTLAVDARRLRDRLQQLPARDPAAETRTIDHLDEQWTTLSRHAVESLVSASLAAGKGHLQTVARLSAGNRGARVTAIESSLRHALGWACTALSVRQSFPLRAGLFDLAIIDEASQCTVADVLPILYRARRIVVVGDAHQLSPVVTLPASKLDQIAQRSGLDPSWLGDIGLRHGEDSAFHACASLVGADRVHLLDEHYRCHPQVAAFVNAQFYGGKLRVLTDVSTLAGDTRGLTWIPTEGATERPPDGRSWINRPEAERVVQWVEANTGQGATMGIVTPFAAQMHLIEREIARRLDPSLIEELELRVGTAHRFQGDERDLMVFSPVVADTMPAKAIQWLMRQRNLLNVAISRARSGLIVIGDAAAIRRHGLTDLMALHEAATTGTVPVNVRDAGGIHSDSEAAIYDALVRVGLPIELKTVVEGYELDFVLRDDRRRLNLEVDGVHHIDIRGRQRRQDLVRDLRLQKLGWHVHRVPAWRCRYETQAVITEIRHVWEALPR